MFEGAAEAEEDGAVLDGGPLPTIDKDEGLAFKGVKAVQIEGEPNDVFVDEYDDAVVAITASSGADTAIEGHGRLHLSSSKS